MSIRNVSVLRARDVVKAVASRLGKAGFPMCTPAFGRTDDPCGFFVHRLRKGGFLTVVVVKFLADRSTPDAAAHATAQTVRAILCLRDMGYEIDDDGRIECVCP